MIEKIDRFAAPDVYLVSAADHAAFLLKKHLDERAFLVTRITDPVVFGAGKDYYVSLLLSMKDYGADSNQCVLVYDAADRAVLWETVLLWNNFGGVSLPILHEDFQKTLSELEKNLTSGNVPVGGGGF